MVTPVQQEAVNKINQKLDDSGWTNTVTHSEMNDVKDILKNLNATDADAVIDELQRIGKLDKLASEGVDGSWFGNGGYSADERRDLFKDLAGKLDGQSLAEVSKAFARTDGGKDGFDRVGELADAVSRHAPNQIKFQYVEAMKGQVTDRPNWHEGGVFVNTSHKGDAEAAAVAKVLTSMKGSAWAPDAFKALNPEQLRAVMSASIDEKLTTTTGMGGASHSVTWNGNGFRDLMDAAASISDPQLKARIFDAGADTLRGVRNTNGFMGQPVMLGKDDTMKAMAEGLTKILDSDVNGVIDALSVNGDTLDGSDLATYSRQMIESGGEAKLGEILAKLKHGNAMNEDPGVRLNEVTKVTQADGSTQDRRVHAGSLGYFVGAVHAGANSSALDTAAKQGSTTAILDSALALIDKAGWGGKIVGTVASVAKEWSHYGVQYALSNPSKDMAQRLHLAALPVNPSTNQLSVGDDIRNAFGTVRDDVIQLAKP